jgi:hypothetical protein
VEQADEQAVLVIPPNPESASRLPAPREPQSACQLFLYLIAHIDPPSIIIGFCRFLNRKIVPCPIKTLCGSYSFHVVLTKENFKNTFHHAIISGILWKLPWL